MNRLSLITWTASALAHGLVLLPFLTTTSPGPAQVYDEGSGQDAFRLEQAITIDSVSYGDAAERVEIPDVAPMIATQLKPLDIKPTDPDVVPLLMASASPTQTVKAAEEPPKPEVKPEEVATQDQLQQTAMVAEKSAGEQQDGGKATALTAYVGKIHGALQKVKASSASGAVGQVTLGFTLDSSGKVVDREVIKSSGITALDRAAVDWLERAAFPPLPNLLGTGQRFNVPLTFKRKSG